MHDLRIWIIITWISLPTVMYGGYALMRLLNRGNVLTPFQVSWFRAGHAHAGVLLVMALVYDTFMDTTSVSFGFKNLACAILAVGILSQSGGFFVHLMVGQPNQVSIGTTVTTVGAALLTLAVGLLAYALIVTP